MISNILAMMPKEKILEIGKNTVYSLINKGTDKTQQEQPQLQGNKFYYPATGYKGISSIFKSFGGK
jgi:hypothetical protein